jgi:threonine dehydratase
VILSGGDTELSKLDLFKEMSMVYEGLKYFFKIKFPRRIGILKEFVECLGPDDEITQIQYGKKEHKEFSFGLVTVEVK